MCKRTKVNRLELDVINSDLRTGNLCLSFQFYFKLCAYYQITRQNNNVVSNSPLNKFFC